MDINAIVKKILGILNFNELISIVSRSIGEEYRESLDDMELELDMNFMPDTNIMRILEEFTFDNIKDMTEQVGSSLRKELVQALMNNETLTSIKDRIKKVMDIADSRAITIARTETTRAQNTAKLQAANQSTLTLKKYLIVTEDSRTSPICGAMDKKYGVEEQAIGLNKKFEVLVNGKVISALQPPFHPNCRTTLVFTQT